MIHSLFCLDVLRVCRGLQRFGKRLMNSRQCFWASGPFTEITGKMQIILVSVNGNFDLVYSNYKDNRRRVIFLGNWVDQIVQRCFEKAHDKGIITQIMRKIIIIFVICQFSFLNAYRDYLDFTNFDIFLCNLPKRLIPLPRFPGI